jgi:hypothetical protein
MRADKSATTNARPARNGQGNGYVPLCDQQKNVFADQIHHAQCDFYRFDRRRYWQMLNDPIANVVT